MKTLYFYAFLLNNIAAGPKRHKTLKINTLAGNLTNPQPQSLNPPGIINPPPTERLPGGGFPAARAIRAA